MADDEQQSPRKRPRLDDSLSQHSTADYGDVPAVQFTGAVQPKKELSQTEQEQAVGITTYASADAPGFRCVVKQRYTDFLVNEVVPNGETLHLLDLGPKQEPDRRQNRRDKSEQESSANGDHVIDQGSEKPKHDVVEEDKNELEDQGGDTTKFEAASNGQATGEDELPYQEKRNAIITGFADADKSTLHSIFGEQTTERILQLYSSVVLHPERKPRDHALVKSEVISDKSKRTGAHVAVRRIFSSKLETSTLPDEQGVIAIKAAQTKGPSGPRGRPQATETSNGGAYQKGKLGWDQLGGEYLHFTLYKENKDTMEVLYFIASQMKVPAKNFQFAGTKDRRGVTVQKVAIFRVHAERIAKLNRFARGWRAGSFEYKTKGLELGELGGNEFLLTLRDCRFQGDEGLDMDQRLQLAQDTVARATTAFQNKGFLNYFGLQRFGSFSIGTHEVGREMLKPNLGKAVDLILSYPEDLLPEKQDPSGQSKVPQDDIDRADAIRTWYTTRNSNKAVALMPRRFQAETAIIQYLGRKDHRTGKLIQDRDWQGCLMQIQRNLRMMYVHAYQSFVWNTVVGKRWELYGDKVVAGDLVVIGEKDDGADPNPQTEEMDEDGEPVFHPAGQDSASGSVESFTRARPLTQAEAESGKYDIFDVVLPLPGFDVVYPQNAVSKFYEELMGSEIGGELDPHNMRRAWKDISMPGDYRKVMSRPGKNFGAEVKAYALEEQQMVETDLERIQNKESKAEKSKSTVAAAEAGDDDKATEGEADGDGSATNDKIAVVLKLRLGSSQYATMALREMTKGGAVNYKPDYSTAR